MMFIERLAGIENAHYFLMDHPDEVEELFAAMHEDLLAKTRVAADAGVADCYYFIENTSTTLLSPNQYEQYCARHIHDYGSILSDAGKRVVLHMCGHLKGLLDQLSALPVHAFEAFTSPTLGNTTLADGREACPDVCLIGGTNAMLWMKSSSETIARLEENFDALPHHRGLVITSAGVMPPMCEPDTIKEVADWVRSYPARM